MFQAALIHDFNERWAAGFGAKLIAPTGTDSLASRKWQVMPGASFRVMLREIGPDSYFVPLVRYDLSVAGDPAAREFWSSCRGADWASVSSLRCDGGSSAQKWLGRIVRRQRAHHQRLPGLRLQSRSARPLFLLRMSAIGT